MHKVPLGLGPFQLNNGLDSEWAQKESLGLFKVVGIVGFASWKRKSAPMRARF
jgi:hypothetical protein